MDLASNLGGKIDKSDVLTAVEKYEQYHEFHGGDEEERKANYTDMVYNPTNICFQHFKTCRLLNNSY
ncbi:BnaUnng01290D [Brassica napus]|uniref:BnaA09g17430D protein n=1 Tax=Brassica napus TaxID=3708 RepID=A0A078JE97_BRANA|nr:BnaA09g17430D [Brassica napus]CDY60334.1 BnaC03g72280D [Brassica napus]CDY65938.1 BnaUnng01290D [Brassica napus]